MAEMLFRSHGSFPHPVEGLVLAWWTTEYPDKPCIGRTVELRRPDGKCIEARIVSIEFFSGAGLGVVGARVSGDLPEQDAPTGTEVWLLDEK